MRKPVIVRVIGFCALVASAAAPSLGAEQAPPAAQSASSTRTALAKQIVATAYPEAAREQMFRGAAEAMSSQMRQSVAANMPAQDAAVLAIVDGWTERWLASNTPVLRKHIPALMDGLVKAYATQFDERELQDLLAFASTSTGRAFFLRQSALISDPAFAAANQAYMQEVLSRLPEAQKELAGELQAHFDNKR